MVRPAVRDKLEKVYEVFGSVPKPKQIDACSHCFEEDELAALLAIPLRQLTPAKLSSYAGSVFLTAGSLEDFRYFLPRILEIFLQDDRWYPDREIVLKNLQRAGWLTWSAAEKNAVQALLEAAFYEAIDAVDDSGDDLDSWICGWGLSGADMAPVFNALLKPENEKALRLFYESNSWALVKNKLSNSFWSDNRGEMEKVMAWLKSDAVQTVMNRHYLGE